MMTIDLTAIWAFVIAFAVFMYVVMDGFDLGIGILFPTFKLGEERTQAMNAIAPVWDGNETWLVLGGGGLMAAFPLAYAIILPATYPLIIAMLLGLIFRGVAFEYRHRDPAHERFWDFAFFAGSLVAALSQGMVLGALLQGMAVDGRAYSGGWLDWLTPYSLLTGAGVVVGYALLGSCFLAMKLTGEAEEHAFRLATRAGIATMVLMGAVSLATPYLASQYWDRWFTMPNLLFVSQVPLLTAIFFFALFRSIAKRRTYRPFLIALGLFALGMAGLGVSMWPFVVPDSITIRDAAAPESSQMFMLVGVGLIMPLILAYTGWAYWVCRGKTGHEGYH
jgi:cytochrome d ubiquinol oxidase subunit II